MEKLDIQELGMKYHGYEQKKQYNDIDAVHTLARKLNEVIDFINSHTNEKKEEVV